GSSTRRPDNTVAVELTRRRPHSNIGEPYQSLNARSPTARSGPSSFPRQQRKKWPTPCAVPIVTPKKSPTERNTLPAGNHYRRGSPRLLTSLWKAIEVRTKHPGCVPT